MAGKKILFVSLNWGLGHATRLMPLISAYRQHGNNLLIGGSPQHISLFKEEFGDIGTVELPYLNIRLSSKNKQLLSIISQLPFIFLQIIREHRALRKVVKTCKIDVVVSDNCYGLWSRNAYSIFITHQVNIKIPHEIGLLNSLVNRINHWFIAKFNECWIPDFEEEGGIAGELSHAKLIKPKVRFLGILSRFNDIEIPDQQKKNTGKKRILIILSGPEDQRTAFERIIATQLKNLPTEYIFNVIRGLPEVKNENIPERWHNHLPAKQMAELITQSDYILCRPGYSTIMDLITLGKTALLIPTPGQTEQEYLANYLSGKGLFLLSKQNELQLINELERMSKKKNQSEYLIHKLLDTHSHRYSELIKEIQTFL
jgi:uncharacterized protein (TIGR00661 family)